MKKYLIAALLSVVLITTAQSKNNASPGYVSWTGAYAGLSVGSYSNDVNVSGFNINENTGKDVNFTLGFDQHLIGNYVLGVRGDIRIGTLDESSGFIRTDDTAADVILRAGYLATSRLLLYGLAGYAYIDSDGAEDLHGFKYGAGAELKIGKIHLSLEYQEYFDEISIRGIDADIEGRTFRAGATYRF